MTACFKETATIFSPFPKADVREARGSHAAAPGFLRQNPVDERGGAHAHERATEASEARMAKRSGRAVNEGLDGLSERLASGCGYLRAGATDIPDCSLNLCLPVINSRKSPLLVQW